MSLFAVWSEESSPMGTRCGAVVRRTVTSGDMPLSKIAVRCRAAIVVVPSLFIGGRVRWRRMGGACVRPCERPAVAAPSNKSALLVKSFDFERLRSLEHAAVPLFSSCFLLLLLLSLSLSLSLSLPPARFHGLFYF